MDFRQHVSLGRTGLMVSRMGIAAGYGVPEAAVEKAFHEYGVNYFYLSFLKRAGMRAALGNLLPKHRDESVVVLPHSPLGGRFMVRRSVEKWLGLLKIDTLDVLILQGLRKPIPGLFERALKLQAEGKVRFIGLSSHNRPLLGQIAGGELDVPVDLLQIRYNAVHRGAEQDIFPHLPPSDRPGTVVFTATCWRKLLKAGNMPAGESPMTAADCYRFVLSNPNVNVCVTGPSSAEQLEANLAAIDAGPLSEEQLARAKRIGDHIYGK